MNNLKFSQILIISICLFLLGCSKDDDSEDIQLIIDLTENPINVSFEGKEILEVEVKTNIEELQIEIDNNALSWLSLTQSNTKSIRDEVLYFNVNENQTLDNREAKVIIRNKDNVEKNVFKELIIKQEGRVPGIYTSKDLITLGGELNKKKEERDSNILAMFGIFDVENQKWFFVQKRDINLNPRLDIQIDASDSRDIKVTYSGEIDNKWVPIGHADEYGYNKVVFEDIYDGGDFHIENLFIEGEYRHAALFGLSENAVFKNINIGQGLNRSYFKEYFTYGASLVAYSEYSMIENVNSKMIIQNQHNVTGGIVGYGSNTEIDNSSFKDSYIFPALIDDQISPQTICGGIVGYSANTTVYNCEISAINIQLIGGTVGGIVGFSNTESNNILNCRSDLKVYAKESILELVAGGIIGHGETCLVENSEASGEITFSEDRYFPAYGGIAGRVDKNSVIAGCKNLISIINYDTSGFSTGNIGGIIGNINSSQVDETSTNLIIGTSNFGIIDTKKAESFIAGGIIGYGKGTSIIGCYNVGQLTTHERTSGSIAGTNDYDRIKGTFWLTKTCARGIGLWGEEFSPEYEKSESDLKTQITVDALNMAISDWNEQNPNNIYNIEFELIENNYPSIRKN